MTLISHDLARSLPHPGPSRWGMGALPRHEPRMFVVFVCLCMSLLLLGMSHKVPRTSKAMSKWRTPPLTVVVKVDTEKGPLTHGASLSSPAVAEGIAESIQTLVAATGSRRSRFRCAKNCGLEPCTSKLAIFQRQRQSLNASKYHKTVAAITKHHETSRGLRAEAPLSWMEFHRRPWNANELNLDQLCSILKERPVFSNLCQVFLLSPWQRLRSDELP